MPDVLALHLPAARYPRAPLHRPRRLTTESRSRAVVDSDGQPVKSDGQSVDSDGQSVVAVEGVSLGVANKPARCLETVD